MCKKRDKQNKLLNKVLLMTTGLAIKSKYFASGDKVNNQLNNYSLFFRKFIAMIISEITRSTTPLTTKAHYLTCPFINISDCGYNFSIYFNTLQKSTNCNKFIVVMQQHWCIVHWGKSYRRYSKSPNITTVCTTSKNLRFYFQRPRRVP